MSADLLNLGGDVDPIVATVPNINISNRGHYTDVATDSRDVSVDGDSRETTDDDESEFDGPPLKKVVRRACKKYDMGTAVMPKLLLHPDVDEVVQVLEENDDGYQLAPSAPQQSRYARFVETEFTAIVIEHHLKWAPLCTSEPGPLPDGIPVTDRLGRYDFGVVDEMVDWALERNIKVKGHVLIWAVTSPTPFLETMTAAQLREAMRRHIFTTMGHFRGRIFVWDVVNEALAPDGTLAPNIFLRKLGPTYIEECFQWAHQADPDAILLYNDNKVEGMGIDSPNHLKSEGFYNLLRDLTHRKIPVHGCGIQAHFNAAGVGRNRVPTPRMVQQQIHRLGELGLRVNISEMDVRVSKLAPNLRQIAQRQIYHDILAAALSEACFDGIWLWGFTDRHTWVHSFYYDDEPLVFDEDFDRKEAYYGLREALLSVTPGGIVGGRGVVLDDDVDSDGNPWGHLWMQPEPEETEETAGGDPTKRDSNAMPDWEQPVV
ncbi:Probable endo-1,4-beta-xylanase C [Seminavis robusta]|uniref:endo-1,4-beta-xylanase n=1 Tax=Seminavis robusta TaxID=568900 RepID=A0A9N8H4Z3_9STRA|nr:Probable endo-1,4-beta-xylanase C [Seminavis robusta]|eukprot:Sro98_g050650.1 Probable endo-1,4-beta-xylanase C (488) ;mRNA; r:109110-110573